MLILLADAAGVFRQHGVTPALPDMNCRNSILQHAIRQTKAAGRLSRAGDGAQGLERGPAAR
jgi:hypothetical protein